MPATDACIAPDTAESSDGLRLFYPLQDGRCGAGYQKNFNDDHKSFGATWTPWLIVPMFDNATTA
jgi:hypothetical protein